MSAQVQPNKSLGVETSDSPVQRRISLSEADPPRFAVFGVGVPGDEPVESTHAAMIRKRFDPQMIRRSYFLRTAPYLC